MILSKRAKALMLCAVMLFTIIFSALVIIIDSNHDCTAEDCQICQTIQLCLEKFRGLGKDNESFTADTLFAVFLVIFSFSVICNDKFSTPVNQKIKLSI